MYAYKLEVEVEEVMRTLGWLREREPGATLTIDTKGCRIEGSIWTVLGGLKYPVKVNASLLWGDLAQCMESH